MIKIHQISKEIKGKNILRDISFELYDGDILGVVGPNGTGKSTLLSILCDINKPTNGTVEYYLDGVKYEGNNKELIGYVPQSIALYNELSVIDNMMIFGAPAFKSNKLAKDAALQMLDRLHLNQQKNIRISKLSGGEKRRVNIGVSILKEPKFIFMDEPVVGVDYYAREDIEGIIQRLGRDNKIIIIVSHQIEFLEKVCNKLLILKEGRQVCFGDFHENKNKI